MTGRYKMSTVCERTGFNQALLRAWERRYDLLRPERTPGGHRLYTDDDLAVLERVRERLEAGQVIGEVAVEGRAALLAEARRAPITVAAPPAEPAAGVDGAAPPDALAARVHRLALAASRIDDRGVEAALDDAFACLAPDAALERVVLPALVEVGALWSTGRCQTGGEHLLSAKVVGRLHALLRAANQASASATHAVCACFPDEGHEIGALACAYALARRGARVTYLGARLPFDGLRQATDVLLPNLLCVSVTRAPIFREHREALRSFAARLPVGVRLVLGGAGTPDADAELEAAGVRLAPPGAASLADLLG